METWQFWADRILITVFAIALTWFITWKIEKYKFKRQREEFLFNFKTRIILDYRERLSAIALSFISYSSIVKRAYEKAGCPNDFSIAKHLKEDQRNELHAKLGELFALLAKIHSHYALFKNKELLDIMIEQITRTKELYDILNKGANRGVSALREKIDGFNEELDTILRHGNY